jgi:hypothetical protein
VKTIIRKVVLILSLAVLILVEAYWCTAFLPLRWQSSIDNRIPAVSPKSSDWTPITHPLLSQEIDEVLREHAGIRLMLYAITVVLLIANALLVRFVWRLLRRAQKAPETQ